MKKPTEILHLEKKWGVYFTRLKNEEFEKKWSDLNFIRKCYYATDAFNKVWGIICRMELQDINGIEALKNVTYLELNYNQLHHVNALSSLTQLKGLSLAGNHLREVPTLASLTQLTHLDLSDNQLSDWEIPASLTDLSFINLSYNGFRQLHIPEALTNLKCLNVRKNHPNEVTVYWIGTPKPIALQV